MDHLQSGMVYNFGCVCEWLCLSVCMYVFQTITFESLDVGSSYLHIRYISREYKSSSYKQIIGSRSRSQEQKMSKMSIFAMQKKTGYNSTSTKHWAMRFACSMVFSAMVDRMKWPPSLSRDWKWPHVTKCTHSRVVGLRLDGNLVVTVFKPIYFKR